MADAYKAAAQSAGCRVLVAVTESYNSKATELDCAGNRVVELLTSRMVDLDMAPLAVALEEANPFSTVDVSYNTLGAGAAESLRKLLTTDVSIATLNLSHNDFTETAAQALCAGLKGNRTVTDLRLSGNKLGHPGGMALADLLQTNAALQRIDASNCELDTAALVALATVLRDNSSLRVLDVSRPLAKTIMDEHISHFARMLKVNTSLVELDLSKARMGDKGLQLLSEELFRAGPASALLVLKACGNAIGLVEEDCVRALMQLLSADTCRLQELHLGSNSLRDEGALKLSEVIVASKRLTRLDVSSNGITSRGLCAIARAVMDHPEIAEMDLWGNVFDSAACLAWIPALEPLKLDIAVQEVDNAYICVRC